MAHPAHAAPSPPAYQPYRRGAAAFQLGLRAMRPEQWILFGDDHLAVMGEKRARLAAGPERYFRALPGSLEAQHELREAIAAHLCTDHPQRFDREGDRLRSRMEARAWTLAPDDATPLLQLADIVEEDFMILQQQDSSAPLITAAANAYSSSGRLVSAVGRGVDWAHVPVPGLNAGLGARVDRVLGSVHADAPCERFNWQVTPLGTLFFPADNPHGANARAMQAVLEPLRADPRRAASLLYIRVERQTLRRLPRTGAVAFGLHTYSDPLGSIAGDREACAAMLGLLRQYDESRWQYSEMDIVREPLLACLEAWAEGGSATAEAPTARAPPLP